MNTYSTKTDHKVRWSFLFQDGSSFALSGYSLSVRIDTGRGSIFVSGQDLTYGTNYIEFDLPASKQVSGVYSLKASLLKGQTFVTEFLQPEAFLLSPMSADTTSTISVSSYAEPLFSAIRKAEVAVDGYKTTFNTNEAARQATFESKEAQRDAAMATISQEAAQLESQATKINDLEATTTKDENIEYYTKAAEAGQGSNGYGLGHFIYKSGIASAAAGNAACIVPIGNMKKVKYRSYLPSVTYVSVVLKSGISNTSGTVVYISPVPTEVGWDEGEIDLTLYPEAKYVLYASKYSTQEYKNGSYLILEGDGLGHDVSGLIDKTTALENNINATVRTNEQEFTDNEKAQARTNIGAASSAELVVAEKDIDSSKGDIDALHDSLLSLIGATKLTFSTATGLMISLTDGNAKIATNSSSSYCVYYAPVSKGDIVNIFGTNSAAKLLRAGFCKVQPVDGTEVYCFNSNGTSTLANIVMSAPDDGYIVAYHYSTYFTDMTILKVRVDQYDKVGTLTPNSVKSGARLILTDGSMETVGSQYRVSTYYVPNAYRMNLYASGRVTSSADSCGIAYYGRTMNFLGYEVSGYASATTFNNHKLNVPAGTTFIRVQTNKNYITASLVVKDTAIDDTDILALNPKSEMLPKIQSISKRFYTSSSTNIDKPTVFAHISDIHGNWGNIPRFIRFCKEYEDYISMMINTGDTCQAYFSDGIAGYAAVEGVGDIINVIGNHDTREGENWQGKANSTDVYNAFISPYVENWGVTQPSDAAANGKCYFYKDIVKTNAPSLRMVFIDCMGYNETQDTWLASVLSDAKTNSYHVVILTHMAGFQSGTGSVMTKLPSGYNSYRDLPENASGFNYYNAYGYHMTETVQSFIDDGGTFVGYMAGHHHYQFISQLVNYPEQLVFVIGCTKAIETYDFDYKAGTRYQDNFQLVSIDTYKKRIKLMKVGANYDLLARHIDTVTVSYDTWSVVSDTYIDGVSRKKIKDMESSKVDKVSGKGLSTNDYTTADKTKVGQITELALKVGELETTLNSLVVIDNENV